MADMRDFVRREMKRIMSMNQSDGDGEDSPKNQSHERKIK